MLTDDEIKDIAAVGIELGRENFTIRYARAIIAAHQAKLLAGVEMPEAKHFYYADDDHRAVRKPLDLFTADQLQQYAAAAAAQARLKALDEAKGVCVERMSFWRLSDDRYYEAESCAYAIGKLKGGE